MGTHTRKQHSDTERTDAHYSVSKGLYQMIPGTLEHAIYLEECYRMDVAEAQIQQMEHEDRLAESPVVLCPGCSAPFRSLGEAYCEACRKTSEIEWHSAVIYTEEQIPF